MYKYTPTHTAPRTDPNPSNSAVASPMRFNATPMREQAREPAPQTQPLKPLQSESTINSENNTSVDIKQFVQQYHQVNRVENTSPGGNAAFNTSSHSDDGTYGFKGDASGNMNANQSQTQTAKLVQVATLQKARIDELNSTIDDLRKELKDYKRMVTDRSTVKVQELMDELDAAKRENDELKEKNKATLKELKKAKADAEKKEQAPPLPPSPSKDVTALKNELTVALEEQKTLRSELSKTKKQLADANIALREARTSNQLQLREAQERYQTEANERKTLQTKLETNTASFEDKFSKMRNLIQASEKEIWNLSNEYSDMFRKMTQRVRGDDGDDDDVQNESVLQYASDCERRRKIAEDALIEYQQRGAKDGDAQRQANAAVALRETDLRTQILELEGRMKLVDLSAKDDKIATNSRIERLTSDNAVLSQEIEDMKVTLEEEAKRTERERNRANELDIKCREYRNRIEDLEGDLTAVENEADEAQEKLRRIAEKEAQTPNDKPLNSPEPTPRSEPRPAPVTESPRDTYSPMARSVLTRQPTFVPPPMSPSYSSANLIVAPLSAQEQAERDDIVEKRLQSYRRSSNVFADVQNRPLPLTPKPPKTRVLPSLVKRASMASVMSEGPYSPLPATSTPTPIPEEPTPTRKPAEQKASSPVKPLVPSSPSPATSTATTPLPVAPAPTPVPASPPSKPLPTKPHQPAVSSPLAGPAKSDGDDDDDDVSDLSADEEDAEYEARHKQAANRVAAHRERLDKLRSMQ